MRRGATLIELLLALAIIALLSALAVPHAVGMLQSIATDGAARRLMAAHRVARFAAITRGQPTLLAVSADSLVVRTVTGTDTLTVWRAEGPAVDGVALTGPTYPLKFSPIGLSLGVGNATYQLTRGTANRQVIISRLGRIRLLRGG